MILRGVRLFAAGMLVALALDPTGARAQAADAIITPAPATRPARADARWARAVHLDVARLGAAAEAGRAVVLDLAPGLSVTTAPERVERRGAGRFTWFGPVEGGGRATLTVEGPRVVGRIVTPHGAVMIEPSGDAHVVYEPSAAGDDRDDAIRPPPGAPSGAGAGVDELFPDELHLAVFYTGAVADSLGDGVGVFLQATVDTMTDILANSAVPARARLVYGGPVAYTEPQVMSDGLFALTDPFDGQMDEVHALRDAASADLVALLVETGGNAATGCGVAFLMASLDPTFDEYAFSVTKRRCAIADLTFAHEVGHNLGLHHDLYVNPGPGLFDYSRGFVNMDSAFVPPDGPAFRTPLAYHNACTEAGVACPKIPYFSNPEFLFGGMPMGDAATADNARTVRQSAPLAATFRAPARLATHPGTTAGMPTWHRPACTDPADPATCALSGSATAAAFDATGFRVTRTGRYYVRSEAAHDGVLLLYAGAFDPAAPLAGLVGYAEPDTEAPEARRLLLPADLQANTPYVLVTTGLTNADAGAFTNATFGPTGAGVVVGAEGTPGAAAFALGEAVPNPFWARTTLPLIVGSTQHVRAEAFDALGRRVALLHDGPVAADAALSLVLDGAALAPGVYLVRVTGETARALRTVTVAR